MADKKSWINIQADTELVVMLDQMVYEAEMETDHSKYIRGLIRKEYARLHPLRIHPEGATTAYAFVTPRRHFLVYGIP